MSVSLKVLANLCVEYLKKILNNYSIINELFLHDSAILSELNH